MSEHELAIWVLDQKIAYKNGKLQDWQIERLESLPGWTWELNEEDYEYLRQRGRNDVITRLRQNLN